MSASRTDELHWVRDRIALRDLVEAYASAVDARDRSMLLDCFTEDAQLTTTRGSSVPATTFVVATLEALGRWPMTHHLVTGHRVEFDRDGARARGCTDGIAVQGQQNLDSGERLIAGLRYLDEYECVGGHWLIRRRELRIIWSHGEWPWPVTYAPVVPANQMSPGGP